MRSGVAMQKWKHARCGNEVRVHARVDRRGLGGRCMRVVVGGWVNGVVELGKEGAGCVRVGYETVSQRVRDYS